MLLFIIFFPGLGAFIIHNENFFFKVSALCCVYLILLGGLAALWLPITLLHTLEYGHLDRTSDHPKEVLKYLVHTARWYIVGRARACTTLLWISYLRAQKIDLRSQ
jgi:hypothetical protein